MKKTARRFGSYDPSPTVVPTVETPTRIVRDPCAIEAVSLPERTFMTLTGRRLNFPSPPRRKAPLGAWPAFERKLAETLGALEEDQYLVVSAKRGWAYVQFAAQGSFGLRAECVGNNYLDEAHALRAGQMARLRRMGWSAPTGTVSYTHLRAHET